MRIVMSSSSFLNNANPVGGEPLHVKSLTEMLIAHGHKVAIMTKDRHVSAAPIPGIDVTFSVKPLFSRVVSKALQIDPVVYIAFLRFLRNWRPDIVHLHACLDLSLAPITAAARLQVPVVVTLHSSWPVCFRHELCYNEDGSCLERFAREVCSACLARGRRVEKRTRVPIPIMNTILSGAWWSRRRVLRSVGRFIVPSATIARRLRESGFPAKQMIIVPHGLPIDDFRMRPQAIRSGVEGAHLLYVGRLDPGKGVQYLLQALRQVRTVHADLTLTVVGDGSFRPALERMATSQGLTAAVRFLGTQPRSRLPDLYAEADLVVIPSLSEVFPYVALEAAATGVPVVTTHVGGIPDILGDGAILVPPMDSPALAHGILTALSDRQATAVRAAYARERCFTRFGCDTMVHRIEAVYAELCDSKKRLEDNP